MNSPEKNSLIPPAVVRDMEIIAADVHESWMKQRSGEGWEYAEVYSFERKKTPFMIPYDELPESEKEMDRATIRQVVRSLIRLGYRIEREKLC